MNGAKRILPGDGKGGGLTENEVFVLAGVDMSWINYWFDQD